MPRKPLIRKLDLYGQVDVGADDPASGTNGQMFFNSTTSALKIYYNGAWVTVGAGTATVDGVYLAENGDYYITEAGDYLATE